LPPKKLRAILFDLDGVLVKSSPIHHRAYLEALRVVGVRRVDYRHIAGMRTAESIRHLLRAAGRSLPKRAVARLIARKQAIAHRLLSVRMPVASGCRAVLKRLARRFRLGLVSSTSRKNVDLFLKATSSRRLFSVVLSGDDVARAKPSSTCYRQALRRLRLRPSQALVVEDAVAGVQAARRLGIRTIALSGTCPNVALRQAGAEKVVRRLSDVPGYAEHL
jgi:HAD superfamily hydrolase (TIGR01509 family)